MDCPKCTHVLRAEARFCDNCGAPVAPSGAPDGQAAADGDAGTLRDDLLVGETLDGKYLLQARLGAGAMGTVYRSLRVHIGDEVAVKVLPQKFVDNAASVERFRREARAAAMLRHPNVVTIYDYGEAKSHDAPAYIVMELLEGMSLRHLLQSEGRIAPRRTVSLMRDICAGVGAAHRRGVLHRDLKPDNVILLPPDEDREAETVKVVDFGIAKLRDQSAAQPLTQAGTFVGTPPYMSPEQCRGESLDARSDVYSLGAMLYEMLSGGPPFTAETYWGVMTKHVSDEPPPLPRHLAVPAAVEAVVMRALAKDPDARQPGASDLARELQEAEGRARQEAEEAQRLAAEERRRAEEELRAAQERARDEEEERRERAAAAERAREEERREREQSEGQRRLAAVAAVEQEAEERRRRDAEARAAGEQQRRKDEAEVEQRRRAAELERREPEAEKEQSPVEATRVEVEAPATAAAAQTRPPAPPAGRDRRVILYAAVALMVVAVGGTALSMLLSAPRGGETPAEEARPTPSVGATTPPAPSPAPAVVPAPPEGMVYVPGGSFLMGRDDGADVAERPAHTETVGPFFIDKYEVTRGGYLAWRSPGATPAESPLLPATGVMWDEAKAYCEARGKRLPTEAEWEFAARGADGRRYPWGDKWRDRLANVRRGRGGSLANVGEFKGESPFGALDMVGNAWEWTASDMRPYERGRLPDDLPEGELKVLRGGSYKSIVTYATTTYRSGWPARDAKRDYRETGFRCVKDIPR